MFKSYMLKDEILYLNIDVNYEFGSFNNKNINIIDEIKKYISRMNINLKKEKIILTCGGIIIGSILLTNNKSVNNNNITYIPSFKDNIPYIAKIEESLTSINDTVENSSNYTVTNEEDLTSINHSVKNNSNYSATNKEENIDNSNVFSTTIPSNSTVTVHRSNGSVITIDLEEYIIGVVAAEMPASFNIEALKAQSVIARTYALKAKDTGKTLTDTVSTQAYIDTNQMQSKWGSNYNMYYNKIKNAVDATNGEYLTYNGSYIEAMYHSTSNGTTESSIDVFGNYYPYLISVNSSYDTNASSYLRVTTYNLDTVNNLLQTSLTNQSTIEILSRTSGDNIKEISLDGIVFTGKQIRELLSLRSTDFDMTINDDIVTFTTRGYGHGVGMSQYGSNGMANAGYGYKDILSHYYPGTILNK